MITSFSNFTAFISPFLILVEISTILLKKFQVDTFKQRCQPTKIYLKFGYFFRCSQFVVYRLFWSHLKMGPFKIQPLKSPDFKWLYFRSPLHCITKSKSFSLLSIFSIYGRNIHQISQSTIVIEFFVYTGIQIKPT